MMNFAKKAISLLCVMSMLFSMVITSSAQQVETTIGVESQTIEQGSGTEEVEVPIKIANNTGILGMTVSVTFDDELTLVNAVKGDALSSLTMTKPKDYTVTPYNLVWDGEASADTNNGVIATLTFEVPKGTNKEYAINIEASGVYDDNVNPLYPTTANGKITVEGKTYEPTDETIISVESQTIEQGSGTEEVEVPIKIANNTGILGMTVSVTFDDELTLVNAVKGDALSSLTMTKPKDYTVTPYNLVWDGEASADTNNGVIATLTFEVPKGTAKDYSINIATSGVFNGDVQEFTPSKVNGKISVIGIEEPINPITSTTIKVLTSSYKFNISSEIELFDENIFVAVYSEDGMLLNLKMTNFEGDTEGYVTIPKDKNISYAKVFVWDDSFCPLGVSELLVEGF